MNHSSRSKTLAASLLLGIWAHGAAWGKDEPPTEKPPVAAVVNGDAIYVGEVDGGMAELVKSRKISREGIDEARAILLRDIIGKRLIVQEMAKEEGFIDQAEVKKQLRRIESKLKERKMTLEQFAARGRVSTDTARNEILWPLVWNKYLASHLADELEGYFKEHHKELDGTEVRVSHILLRADSAKETKEQVIKRAEKIRKEIESKKITFEQAAERYSAGPSRVRAGDLGFFPRYGVMAEDFSKAAFDLEKGGLSEPVNTNFGTHLILATDLKPGSRQWTEVVPQIQQLAARQIFSKLTSKLRETATIEYTGNTAYLKDGSDELVVPKNTAAK